MREEHGIRGGLTNYGDKDFAEYLRSSFARSMGLSKEMLRKPIVGIAETGSGFNNCHRTMPELVEAVSRGVLAAGGLPRPFPYNIPWRGFPEPHQHGLSEPDVHGHRGNGARAADGCCCAHRWL